MRRTAPSYLCDCLQLYTPSYNLCSASDILSIQNSSYQTFHCWFLHLFRLWPLYIKLPSPSTPTKTLSGLLQMKPPDNSFSKTIDLPCFPFNTAIFLCLKSVSVVCESCV